VPINWRACDYILDQGTYQQFNQAHSLTTPVIDAMGSLLALTELQNWTIADVMTTSERVIRIRTYRCPILSKISNTHRPCGSVRLAKFTKLPGWDLQPL
jgi:hypothetical protein